MRVAVLKGGSSLERTVSLEVASIIFSRTTGLVSDSVVASQTVPVQTPCAPIAIAPAICSPVTMPPAASTVGAP